ncbi:MAG: outer membrane beta-barrel protein [Rikenellaceae bacterium]
MIKSLRYIVLMLALLLVVGGAKAQTTVGVFGGFGSSSESIYPSVYGRSLYGLVNGGVSWRNYSAQPVIGCVGADLLYMQRGFSFSPNSSLVLEGEEYYYYKRTINSLVVPLVWQPHFYIADHRIRVFGEAAVTFSYDLSSTYDNDYQRQQDGATTTGDDIYSGSYDYKLTRDNRFGYGLMGGGGIAILMGRIELFANVRYYFGLSDVVRNRNKYYSNNIDGYENPFSTTPIRSSLNNLMASFGLNYHFGPEGFDSWRTKRVKGKIGSSFGYSGVIEGQERPDFQRAR